MSRRTECQVLAGYVARAAHNIAHERGVPHAHDGTDLTSVEWGEARLLVAVLFPELWDDHADHEHGCG